LAEVHINASKSLPNNIVKKMKIILISKLWEEVSPESRGGTGVFAGNLAEGLTKRGHKVFLFATGNSTKKVTSLFSVIKKPFKNYSESYHYLNITQAFEYANKIKADIIHACVDHTALYFSKISKVPSLHTIDYGDLFLDNVAVLKKYKSENFVTVSEAMKQKFPYLNWQGVVYHGIDINKFTFSQDKKRKYLLFLGRLSPQKGPDIAIQLARKVKIPLVLAGKISDTDKIFLKKKVLPYIDGKFIRYVGIADFKKKINLFKSAKALVHPIRFFEAFGLTLIEAGACGVPVLSFDSGAPKEIIQNNKSGFIVKNLEEMKRKVLEIDKINPVNCRKLIEEKFTTEKMVSNYEKIYQKVINKSK
jgi:glycosyltransferase involved in cell wall biosynthesis